MSSIKNQPKPTQKPTEPTPMTTPPISPKPPISERKDGS